MPDTDRPVLCRMKPRHLATGALASTNIQLDIVDTGDGIKASSVVIKVNGAVAWQSEAQQSGFVVTRTTIADGHRYLINPNTDFSSGAAVQVEVYAEDLAVPANVLNVSRTFHLGPWT